MLLTKRVNSIPAGKAPQRGADAVKASYRPCSAVAAWAMRTGTRGPVALQEQHAFTTHITWGTANC
jgi:hypothetical protein